MAALDDDVAGYRKTRQVVVDRNLYEGKAEPVDTRSPASTHWPSSTVIWVRRITGKECSRTGARVAPVPASSYSMYSGSTTTRWADPGRVSSSVIRSTWASAC